MKIQFGTPLTTHHGLGTFFFGCAVFAISWFNGHLESLFGDSKKAILHSRGLNLTHIPSLFYCDVPYDDCLCPVLSNKSENSENCITNVQLVGSRILPAIVFFLQMCLIRELFSLSGDHRHVIIYALWIASMFTFVGMIISIYWNSCYHAYIALTLCSTGGLLWFLSLHNLLANIDRIPSSSHSNKIVPVHRSKRNHNATRAWQELP
jgi:hypothetical protein